MEEEQLLNWKEMYGEVVWAKVGSFPWWPCYIYDPEEMPAEIGVIKQGMANIGKQYSVYYYGDSNYGFTKPNMIKPYSDANREIYSTQKVGKRYAESFATALQLADKDVLLPKMNRVAWHIPENPANIQQTKHKIKRPPSKEVVDTDGEVLDEVEGYFDKTNYEEDEEEEIIEEEEPDSENSDAGSEASEASSCIVFVI